MKVPVQLKVNGSEWKMVKSLTKSKARDLHYTIDRATGRIAFGNGVQGRKPPKGATIDVVYRFSSGSSGNTGKKLFGIFRGIVVNNIDPQARLRLMIQAPDAGISPSWAASCTPVGSTALPKVGAGVWVAFEGGDASFPVWIGVISP